MSNFEESSYDGQEQSGESDIPVTEVRASLSRVAVSAEAELMLAESLRQQAIAPPLSAAERAKAADLYLEIAKTALIRGQTLREVEAEIGLNKID